MPFSLTHRTQNISKNQKLYPQQSQITLFTLPWDTLYVSTVNTLIQVVTHIMKSRVQNWCQQGPWNVWIFANHSFNVITRLQKRIVINRTRTALLQSLFITWGRVVSFIYGNTGWGVSSLEIQNLIKILQRTLWYLSNWN